LKKKLQSMIGTTATEFCSHSEFHPTRLLPGPLSVAVVRLHLPAARFLCTFPFRGARCGERLMADPALFPDSHRPPRARRPPLRFLYPWRDFRGLLRTAPALFARDLFPTAANAARKSVGSLKFFHYSVLETLHD
jgi:hypothetical protein